MVGPVKVEAWEPGSAVFLTLVLGVEKGACGDGFRYKGKQRGWVDLKGGVGLVGQGS